VIAGASQAETVLDVTPDRRNSFPPADEKLLGRLQERLLVTVHLASSDPRFVDLDRKILARLKRAMPQVAVRIAEPDQASLLGRRRRRKLWRDRPDLSRKERHDTIDRRGRNPAHSLRPRRGQCTPA